MLYQILFFTDVALGVIYIPVFMDMAYLRKFDNMTGLERLFFLEPIVILIVANFPHLPILAYLIANGVGMFNTSFGIISGLLEISRHPVR